MWQWFKKWVGEGPERPERTLEEMQDDAYHMDARARELQMRPGPFNVTHGEYVTLLKAHKVDFIYERGHVQRPLFLAMEVVVKG